MAKPWIPILCALAFPGVKAADDLSDFSNNLATDLGPLLVLFGDSMTKQYLSESTSFLDYFIFAVAPIGVLTAIISTIRVCGHTSLRAFIGRSQEGNGAVEAELCTSTSRDVCELFNKGGITRVLGRPSILELVYFPASKSLRLLRYYLQDGVGGSGSDSSWWEREKDPSWSKTDSGSSSAKGPTTLAPNPNLSLNVGIKRQPDWVLYAIATLGFVLQAGVLVLAGVGVWILRWNLAGAGSSASRTYAPVMFIVGTVLMCGGMWGCAALIGQTTSEVRYRRTMPRQDERPEDRSRLLDRPRLFWLQPGPQIIGDQSFDPFAFFEDTDPKKGLQVWTSSKKDLDEKFEVYTLFAVVAVLFGYILQFIGLRGMKAWVSLAHLGITIVMSILRGWLRMQRLGKNSNKLLAMPDLVAGHELDWLSFEIVGGGQTANQKEKKVREEGGKGENKVREEGRKGEKKVEEEERKGTVPVWHVDSGFAEAIFVSDSADATSRSGPVDATSRSGSVDVTSRNGSVGATSRSGSESRGPLSRASEEARTKPSTGVNYGTDDAQLLSIQKQLSIRKQLAHLTGNIAFSKERKYQQQQQHWEHSRVKVRAKVMELSNAICHAAGDLWKRRQWKDMKNTQNVELRIRAVASPNARQETLHDQFISIRLKPPGRIQPDWTVDSAQLEAILGLWMWTLVYDERVMIRDDTDQEVSLATDIPCARIISTDPVDGWGRKSIGKGEMDLWLGPDAVTLVDEDLILSGQICHSMASLWSSDDISSKVLSPRDTKCEKTQHDMKRFCGWYSTYKLQRPVASDSTSTSDQQGNKSVKLRVQHTPTSGSLLDVCAQELFVSLMLSLTAVLIVEEKTTFDSIQLQNPTIASFAMAFAECRLGSYSDALLCLIPAFRGQLDLPSSENMLSALLRAADTERMSSRWDRAQTLLRWACERYYPLPNSVGDESALALRDRHTFARALRATGELCRLSLAQDPSDERQRFGFSGLAWMHECYGTAAGSKNPEVREILECYEYALTKFSTLSKSTISHPGGRDGLQKEAARLVLQATQERERQKVLCYLGFVRLDDFGSQILEEALPLAVRNDWDEVVEAIMQMKEGQSINPKASIVYCAGLGRELCLQIFIDSGAGPSLDKWTDRHERTPLILAARNGHRRVIELILGFEQILIDAKELCGMTALHCAAEKGHEAIIRVLLEKGANIEATDIDGRTALTYATANRHEATIRLLREKGANVDPNCPQFMEPLFLRRSQLHEEEGID